MNLLIIAIQVVLANFIGEISCGKKREPQVFRDAAEALNHIHDHLPEQTAIDEKCKWYAVISTVSLTERSPHIKTVSHLLSMEKNQLNDYYDRIGIDKIIYASVNAADRYRVTQLAPAFINLIECMERIDSPVVREYLSNQEIVLTINLYKQVLGLPGTKVDLPSLDLTKFSRAFWPALRHLFRPFIDIDRVFGAQSDPDQGQPSRNQKALFQRREISRLRKQRDRLIHPDAVQRYQIKRKELLKQREKARLAQSPDPNEILNRIRVQRTERRRKNRMLVEEQRQHQRMLRRRSSPTIFGMVKSNQLKPHYEDSNSQALVEKVDGQIKSHQPEERPQDADDVVEINQQGHLDNFISFLQSIESQSREERLDVRESNFQSDNADKPGASGRSA